MIPHIPDTETDELMQLQEDMPSDDEPVKGKRNYFAIYHDASLLAAVEKARGTESANAFLTRLICSALNVPVPERRTRRRFANKAQATEVHELERAASAEATRIMAQKEEYAKLLAEAMAALQ
jgi:hypothetical protein